MYDIVLIGHICLDHFQDPVATRLGGTMLYGGLTAARLNKKVAMITPIASDLPQRYLEQLKHPNITIETIKTKEQTEFTHLLRGDIRHLALERKSTIIQAHHVPEPFLNTRICLMGAICNEINLSVLELFAENRVPLAIELQGFVRRILKNGQVELKKSWREAPEFLRHVKYVKGALNEAIACLGISPKTDLLEIARNISALGPETVVITAGRKGAHIYHKNFFLHIPPISFNCVDRTGAGDTFFTAFILHALETENVDILASGLFASAAASFVIEDYGAKRFGSHNEIKKRIQEFLQK